MTTDNLPIEEGIENNQLRFEEVDDYGLILRTLRMNQGYTIVSLAKMLNKPPQYISRVERSEAEIPNDVVLREWLKKLGCKDNLKSLLTKAHTYRVIHTIRLHSGDISNPDMIRLIDAYKDKSLSPLDRDLLKLLARE